MDKLAERMAKLSTSALCDVGLKLGVRPSERVVMRRLRPASSQASAVGRARTVQMTSLRDRGRSTVVTNMTFHSAFVDQARPGDFIVIAIAGGDEVASFGDILATKCLQRGVTGVAINGYYRDAAYIERMGLPVWALGTTMIPQGSYGYSVQSVNEPVTCAGAEVQPDDYIAADGDGVIVIPAAEAEKVVSMAEEILSVEERAKAGAKAGGDLGDLYPKKTEFAKNSGT